MTTPPSLSRKMGLGLVAGIASLALVGSFGPTASADQPRPDDADRALAQSEGISVDEARAQLAQDARLSDTAADLTSRLGASEQAGSWIGEDGLVVAVTTEAAAKKVRAAGATPKLVERSQAKLDSMQTSLNKLGANAGKVSSWSVDPVSNTVTVQVPAGANDAATKAFVAKAKKLGAKVETSEAVVTPAATVLGGQEYTMSVPGGTSACSTGFNARSATGARVVITAGHCTEGASNFRYKGTTLGTAGVTRFPTDDYGTINLASIHTGAGAVDTWNGSSVRVTGSQAAAVGATLCKSGRTTRWTCGRVTAKNATVNYGGGDVVYGLTQHNACVMQGDSGGANMSGTQAQGVSSGGALYQTSSGLVCGERVGRANVSYFQPVNEVLSTQRLTLVTS